MKNKTFKRLICFLLALVVMVSLPLDLQANAVALELGWVTWALVSYLAASGFAFAVTGGIQALQSEVEQQVDEYYTVTGIDLFQLIAQSLKIRPPNGGGLGNGFWFGAAAVAAIADFIDWVRNNGWFPESNTQNENTSLYLSDTVGYVYINGVKSYIPIATQDGKTSFKKTYNNKKLYSCMLTGNYIPNNCTLIFGFPSDSIATYQNTNAFYITSDWSITSMEDNEVISDSTVYSSYVDRSPNDIIGIMVAYSSGSTNNELSRAKLVYIYSDGYMQFCFAGDLYRLSTTNEMNDNLLKIGSTSIITSPSEVTEFDVQSDEYVEIDFSVFENETTFEEPEQLAEAIKQQIIDTGTTPQIITQVITETIPQPTPVPTPVPTPIPSPEIEDIDDLGLPTLGEAIFNKFPFSLPKDLKRIADILNAEPVTPFWEVNLFETLGNRVPFVDDTTIRIDLAEYEALGQISRWASVITFVIFLVIITKGVIRW